MTSLVAARRGLLGAHVERGGCSSVVHVHTGFHVASILQEFDAQRRELMRRASGSEGAFTGFTRLDTRPQLLLELPEGSSVVVRTTLCKIADRQTLVELIAHREDNPEAPLVTGIGVAIHTGSIAGNHSPKVDPRPSRNEPSK